jgi:hypothetical protein
MPMLQESVNTKTITVAGSAPFELMWILHCGQADHKLTGPFASLESIRTECGPALNSFWDDGLRGSPEVVALAYMSDTLLDLDLEAFFGRLGGTARRQAPTPSLLSETPSERAFIAGRLELLRSDSALRARYVALMKDVWEGVRPEWESSGRPAVLAAAEDWRRRLADGTAYKVLLERPRLWLGRP